MKTTLFVALATSFIAIPGPVAAQQGRLITQADIAAAHTLFDQINVACAAGSKNKACGVLAYSPENCAAKRTDVHTRQIYNTYDDRTVRFQAGGTQVVRRPPIALLAPLGIIGRDGSTTSYASPQFVSWDDYESGKRSVTVCGKSERIEAKDFILANALEKFLKANP
jgi:hypothetical protein